MKTMKTQTAELSNENISRHEKQNLMKKWNQKEVESS